MKYQIFVTFYYYLIVKIAVFKRQHMIHSGEIKHKVKLFISLSSSLSLNHLAIVLYVQGKCQNIQDVDLRVRTQ